MLLIRSQKNLKQKAAYEVVGVCRVMKRLVALNVIALTSELRAKVANKKIVFCVIALMLNSFADCGVEHDK